MAVVKIDDQLLNEVFKFVGENHIEYPNVKNFIDKAVKEKLEKVKRRK